MKEPNHCTPGVCPGATAQGETVSIYVAYNHPLLQLKRALPWEALVEVMTRYWRRAGKNTEGRPGWPWDVALYVPLVVLMLVKNLHARDMEAYLAENVVARVFIGRTTDLHAQMRDHSNIARAYVALGKDGVEEVHALILHVAKDHGFADVGLVSSDTTAQALPIGYPNEPGILRGVAQRCGRALAQLKARGVLGVDTALQQGETILRSVKEHHLFAKGKAEKRRVLTRLLTEVGQLVVQTRVVVKRLGQRGDRVTQRAVATLVAMHEVAKRLVPQIVQWMLTGVVAKHKILHAGVPQARAIVRNKAGKKVEFGVPYLLSRLGGGYIFGTLIRGIVDESKDALTGLGRIPRYFWSARDPRVVGLRSGRRCHGHAEGVGPRGGHPDWHPAQRPAGVARCRGRPSNGPERTRQDRRHHWDTEDGQIWVQQAQGTSVADAGDGRPPVYPRLQSEQTDARCGAGQQVRRKDIGAGKTPQTQLPERDKGGQEALIASKEFCDTPYLLRIDTL